MKVVVQDASVLIDLTLCDLPEPYFRLKLETLTTSFVWHEVSRKHQKLRLKKWIESGDFRIEPIGSDSLTSIVRLQMSLPAMLSLEDTSALFLAESLGAILLTSDKVLRRCADERGLEVHGLLWLMDLLVSRGRILPEVAADRLEYLCRQETAALPEIECRRRIEKWRYR